jgi:hypothetical protein
MCSPSEARIVGKRSRGLNGQKGALYGHQVGMGGTPQCWLPVAQERSIHLELGRARKFNRQIKRLGRQLLYAPRDTLGLPGPVF